MEIPSFSSTTPRIWGAYRGEKQKPSCKQAEKEVWELELGDREQGCRNSGRKTFALFYRLLGERWFLTCLLRSDPTCCLPKALQSKQGRKGSLLPHPGGWRRADAFPLRLFILNASFQEQRETFFSLQRKGYPWPAKDKVIYWWTLDHKIQWMILAKTLSEQDTQPNAPLRVVSTTRHNVWSSLMKGQDQYKNIQSYQMSQVHDVSGVPILLYGIALNVCLLNWHL